MTTRNTISTNRSIIRNTFYIQLTAFILLSLSSSVGSMIAGLARDIRYTCVLKLNNILVKI